MKEGKTRYVILGLLGEGPMSGYTIKKLVDARFRFFWSESYGQLYPELKALLQDGLVETVGAEAEATQPAQASVPDAVPAQDAAAAQAHAPTAADAADAIPVPKSAGRRERIAYRITPAGRDDLRKWLERPVERESVRFEILLKMYFASQGDRKALVGHLREFEAHYAAERAILGRYQAELERIPDAGGEHRDILRVIDFGQRTYDAYLAWCRSTLAEWEGRADR